MIVTIDLTESYSAILACWPFLLGVYLGVVWFFIAPVWSRPIAEGKRNWVLAVSSSIATLLVIPLTFVLGKNYFLEALPHILTPVIVFTLIAVAVYNMKFFIDLSEDEDSSPLDAWIFWLTSPVSLPLSLPLYGIKLIGKILSPLITGEKR